MSLDAVHLSLAEAAQTLRLATEYAAALRRLPAPPERAQLAPLRASLRATIATLHSAVEEMPL